MNLLQFEPVQALGSWLILVDLGQSRVDGGVSRNEAIDMSEPKEPADAVHHRVDRRSPQVGSAEMPDVQLDVRTLDSEKRVEPIRLAPCEPAAELVGVELMGVVGVPGQVGDSRQLRRRHRVRLERQQDRFDMACSRRPGEHASAPGRRTYVEAPCQTLGRAPARLAAV